MNVYIFIILVLFLLTIPVAHAEDTFKTIGNNIWHKSNPTVCIMEPEPSLQERFYGGVLYDAYSSVKEWQNGLIDYSGGNWNMDVRFYDYEYHEIKKVDVFPQCQIFMVFEEYSGEDALGTTSYDYSHSIHQYAYITTYLKHLENPVIALCIGCDKDLPTEITIDMTPIYMPYPAVKKIMMHELGHAIGLGHYIEDKSKNNNVSSLMYPSLDPFDVKEFGVESVDFQMAVEIYAKDGFGGLYGLAPKFIGVDYLKERFLECRQLPMGMTKMCP